MPVVVAPPPYWLRDSHFTTMRLSLRLINTHPNFHDSKYENQCGEFKGVVRDLVKVQLGFTKLEVPFPYLIPERPECNGKLLPHLMAHIRCHSLGLSGLVKRSAAAHT